MKPTVGSIVHYQSFGTPQGEYNSLARAAVVTEVREHPLDDPEEVKFFDHPEQTRIISLCIVNPTGMFFNTDVPYSDVPKAGHWNWPPRE